MQRIANIFAYFFICVNCFAQQYPFVHYTPKDGLINSRVRKAYQDSKGRMYFLTFGGLSVYDGARFKNYTTQDGLENNLINDVLEVGDDSLLVATNNGNHINVLVKGKVGILNSTRSIPVINHFYRHENGQIYLSTDNGLFVLGKNEIRELNISSLEYLDKINGLGNWLVFSSNEMNHSRGLYLYDISHDRIADSIQKNVSLLGKDENKNIWISASDHLFVLDQTALASGKLSLVLPGGFFKQAKDYATTNIAFEKKSIWFVCSNKEHGNSELRHIDENGTVLQQPLSEKAIASSLTHFFIDKERSIWLCNDGEGVFKFVNSPLQVFENPFGKPETWNIIYSYYQNDVTWFITNTNTLIRRSNQTIDFFKCNINPTPYIFHEKGKNLLAIDNSSMYKGAWNDQNKTIIFQKMISLEGPDFFTNKQVVDPNGNIIAAKRSGLSVWKNNRQLLNLPFEYYPDGIENLVFDNNNLLWVAKRYTGIDLFSIHPEDTSNYLHLVRHIPSEQIKGSLRCFVRDKTGLIWIGTREDGLTCYRLEAQQLVPLQQFHSANGLTDNFIIALACDSLNNIIVGTQTGLDRILRYDERSFRIENLSKNSNYFSFINQVWADANRAYARSYSGTLLEVSPPSEQGSSKGPQLLLEEVKVNNKNISREKKDFRYDENNLGIIVAAPSFIDEKQVMYSYLLKGSRNDSWSDTSAANAVINLTNLSPAKYSLSMKAFFPSGIYPPAELTYSFEIAPPWWQTRWFKVLAGLMLIGIVFIVFRYYYNRRLEKQMTVLEKQKAIEKERTRIATDMHDDLGAGLSRIKFLSRSILNKKENDEVFTAELEKITSFSDEMSEKMGEIIWALNEKNDTLADLIAYTRSYAVDYLANHGIECEADTPLQLPDNFITGEMRRNIFLSVKECLHNIVKHAQATKVFFSVQLNGKMQIIIHDNGKGIDWNNQRAFSNGITNIKRRMEEINGSVDFSNEKGTKVSLTIPLIL